MTQSHSMNPRATSESWLKLYYFTRAAFSVAWIAALLASKGSAALTAVLLVGYPAWDALSNLVDAKRSGGLGANRTQLLNVAVSLAVAVALAVVLPDMWRVFAVFGVWAVLSGLLQLATALRRWSTHGAQWAMILSGAQSALAGAFFVVQATGPAQPAATALAGYAGFGAFYFLVSAVLLSFAKRRQADSAPSRGLP